jgi:peptide deformylase
MAILTLVPRNDPILQEKLPRFDFLNPDIDPVQLAVDLTETMLSCNGIGLAANQVGLRHRVFVIKSAPVLACFNPVVVDHGEDFVTREEGCLSFPGLFVKIRRPQVIRVRYTQPNGETITRVFQDLTAQIFQHELDHLDGIVFTKRASRIHLEQAENRRKRMQRAKS